MRSRRTDRSQANGTPANGRPASRCPTLGRRRSPLLPLLLAALMATFTATSAAAFRPSSRWLLDQAAHGQLRRQVRTLRVQQEATLYDVPTAPRGLVADERTWFLAPEGMRNEVELPEGPRVHIVTGKRRIVQEQGKAQPAGRGRQSLLTDPMVVHFLAAGPPIDRAPLTERLERDLKALKVDLDVVSYGRFDGRVAYIIGAKPWETDRPQVWLDKDTLFLLRVVQVEPGAGEGRVLRRELRLLGYGSPEGGSWFPKVIEEWEGERLVKRSLTREVDKNEPLDKALFEAP